MAKAAGAMTRPQVVASSSAGCWFACARTAAARLLEDSILDESGRAPPGANGSSGGGFSGPTGPNKMPARA